MSEPKHVRKVQNLVQLDGPEARRVAASTYVQNQVAELLSIELHDGFAFGWRS